MNADPQAVTPSAPLKISPRRAPRRSWLKRILFSALFALIAVPAALFAGGYRPDWIFQSGPKLPELTIDRGALSVVVVESGTLENSDNATVRCKVEALLGTVGGQGQGMGMGGMGGGGGAGGGGGGRGGSRGGSAGYSSGGGSMARGGTGKAAGATKGAAGKTAAAGGSATGGTGAGGMGGGAATTGIQRPVVTSFSYMVTPHIPLRPALAAGTQASTINQSRSNIPQQGGQQMGEDRQGSTRILKILEEGKHVDEGEIVCWLDDAAFRDELQAELIKWTQAKSWVEQAEKALEVVNIELEEYRDGVYPRDLQLIEQYILTCEVQYAQAKMKHDWAKAMLAKGLQSPSQVMAAEMGRLQTEVATREANRMHTRLVSFSMPKILANLKAKRAAVESDLQAQRAAFTLEDQRKRRLETAIANCELRAPREGMVVYANQANRWGRVENPIIEGMTVRENQAIFQIPNSSRMKLKAKVNESKVDLLKEGTRAVIRVEAIPDRLLHGTVDKVTVIPVNSNGPISDVKVYYADLTLDEDGNYEGMRPGMTARVEFLVQSLENVPRVPIRSLRWFDGKPYAATTDSSGKLDWKLIGLGARDEYFAQVLSGIEPGQKIVADPSNLPAPALKPVPNANVALSTNSGPAAG